MPHNTVVGVFENDTQAQEVADDLKEHGFSKSDIHVTSNESQQHGGFVAFMERLFGIGPAYEEDVTLYQRELEGGKCVVAVDADETHTHEAADIMIRHGASRIQPGSETTGEAHTSTTGIGTGSAQSTSNLPKQGVDRESGRSGKNVQEKSLQERSLKQGTEQAITSGSTQGGPQRGSETQSIPVVKENVEIGKRTVVRGGVRVYSQVTERPVDQEVRLKVERVTVERRPVSGSQSVADPNAIQNRVLEVTETTEEPVVKKSARVVEEVVVGKESRERTEKVHATARETDVVVEPISGQVNTGREQKTASLRQPSQSGQTGGKQTSVSQQGSVSGSGYQGVTVPPEYSEDFQRHFQVHYAPGRYTDYEPWYNYGYGKAGETVNKGKKWEDVEETLRTDFLRSNPNSNWDRIRGAVRYGWERVTGKR